MFTSVEKRHLSGEIFRGSNLDWLDFSGADLRGARFESTSLCGCDFSGADLTGNCVLGLRSPVGAFSIVLFLRDNSFRHSWLTGAEGITRSLFEYIRAQRRAFRLLLAKLTVAP